VGEIKKILVPVSDIKSTRQLMKEAVSIASKFGASVTAMHVLPPLPRTYVHVLGPYRKHLKEESEVFMNESEKICVEKNIPFQKNVVSGIPKEEILKFAKDKNYDLIIVGSSDLKSRFLGSVANGVVHGSSVSVLIVK